MEGLNKRLVAVYPLEYHSLFLRALDRSTWHFTTTDNLRFKHSFGEMDSSAADKSADLTALPDINGD
jgi:hypothetical protein